MAIARERRILGWCLYDWAAQPYYTLLWTFIFGPYFAKSVSVYFAQQGMGPEEAEAQAQSLWSAALAAAGLFIGFSAPILGAIADGTARHRSWIAFFSTLHVMGAIGLWWLLPDGTNYLFVLCSFVLGFIGLELAFLFTSAQLPHVARPEERGVVSGRGFAFGYAGGLLSLAIVLLFLVEQPDGKTLIGLDPAFGLDPTYCEGTRFIGPFVAIWFLVSCIPYFKWVRFDATPKVQNGVKNALRSLWGTIRGLPKKTSLFAFLASSMFYRDALNGLYAFGGLYAALVLDWEITFIGIFGVVSAIGAVFFSWLGGYFDRAYGSKPVIIVAVWSLIIVCICIFSMTREQIFGITLPASSIVPDVVFFLCGVLIGGFGGVMQAASRTLMSAQAAPSEMTKYFGLYGLSGRATAFLAPTAIGLATFISGDARFGVLPLILIFALGLFLLRWVHDQK